MNGLLIIDKEKSVTSHDVVNQIRKIFNMKKVGHVGTLDPISTGVLVILLGNATKLAPFLENDKKEYIAKIRFGMATDTYDVTGNITEQVEVLNLTESVIDDTLSKMKGVQLQKPPIYSAIKIAGKKLYEYARSNKEVERPTREIEVYEAKRITPLILDNGFYKCDILFHVSKGTYIRSLINDLGTMISIPSCMEELRRTKSGKFNIEKSAKLSDIQVGKFQLLNPLEILEMPIMKVDVNSEIYRKAINGMKISPNVYSDKPFQFAVECNDRLIAIYEFIQSEIPHYKSIRVWND